MAWIEIDGGVAIPAPDLGSGKISISTLVDGGRNQNGNFIGQPIGNDKLKVEMKFTMLSSQEMMNFLKLFDRSQGGSFVNRFRVFDPRINGYTYLTMYVGDRSGTPYMVNPQTLRPSFWKDVTANLIQV
jgi:hypothetical protein